MKINEKKHITKNGIIKNNPSKIWNVVFENGSIVQIITNETNRNIIIMKARKQLSESNRYNFDVRRASGGRILRVYEVK